MRVRRWHPRGKGWIRTLDYGRTAAWMRPHPEGGLEVCVYDSCGFGSFWEDGVGEVWIVHCLPGSWLPKHIQDKPHRVRWALDSENGHEIVTARYSIHNGRFPAGVVKRRHRREHFKHYYHRWPLPRKLVAAINR